MYPSRVFAPALRATTWEVCSQRWTSKGGPIGAAGQFGGANGFRLFRIHPCKTVATSSHHARGCSPPTVPAYAARMDGQAHDASPFPLTGACIPVCFVKLSARARPRGCRVKVPEPYLDLPLVLDFVQPRLLRFAYACGGFGTRTKPGVPCRTRGPKRGGCVTLASSR